MPLCVRRIENGPALCGLHVLLRMAIDVRLQWIRVHCILYLVRCGIAAQSLHHRPLKSKPWNLYVPRLSTALSELRLNSLRMKRKNSTMYSRHPMSTISTALNVSLMMQLSGMTFLHAKKG